MKKIQLLLFALLGLTNFATAQTTVKLIVTNPLNCSRTEEPVVFKLGQYKNTKSATVTIAGKEQPCQLDDLDNDGSYDELCFLTNLQPHAKQIYSITLNKVGSPKIYTPKVYVEMLLNHPKNKTNRQNTYISSLTVNDDADPYQILQHHGPSFESELVAYRIYFDKRQTVDIYGKYRKALEIHDTQFYPDQKQKAENWGDDILWVGETFGLGTFRGWDGNKPLMVEPVKQRTEQIIARGPLRTIVEIKDFGWNPNGKGTLDVTTRYTLYAGHRDCIVDITFREIPKNYQFATGIINIKNSTEFSDHKGLRGCWGTDWPVSEKDSAGHKRETVGLGICIPQKYIASELNANKDNYPFVIATLSKTIHYSITFGSDNESFGYHSEKEWFTYLKEWKKDLENPIIY